MTTPATPERMTDEQLAKAQMEWRSMEAELDRARSGEEQAGRDRDDLARANASLARERDLAIEAHYNATADRDAIRQRVIDLFDGGFTTRRAEAQTAADALRELVGLPAGGAAYTMARHPEVRARERAEAERDEARRERDAERAVARETAHQLGEVGAARLKAECERDVARAEVERLKAQIDRMRQRIQELEEHRG